MVDSIGHALDDLAPATLAAGRGQATFAVNRRNNPEADVPSLRAAGRTLAGPVDHDVPVLRVTRPDGTPLAILFGYACHPTTLSLMTWNGDYPGFAQLAIEERHPGTTAMFVNTCGGDQNPLPRRTVELCMQYGRELAAGVEEALAGDLRPIAPTLATAYRSIELPYLAVITRAELLAIVSDPEAARADAIKTRWATRLLARLAAGESFPASADYPLHAWRLGDTLMLGMGGGDRRRLRIAFQARIRRGHVGLRLRRRHARLHPLATRVGGGGLRGGRAVLRVRPTRPAVGGRRRGPHREGRA